MGCQSVHDVPFMLYQGDFGSLGAGMVGRKVRAFNPIILHTFLSLGLQVPYHRVCCCRRQFVAVLMVMMVMVLMVVIVM